jgi:hypothetical protein
MPASQPFGIDSMAVDNLTWQAVPVPFACNSMVIRNDGPGSCLIRTDSADSDTEDTIWVGGEFAIAAPRQREDPARFKVGSTPAYLKAASGAITVKLRFVD